MPHRQLCGTAGIRDRTTWWTTESSTIPGYDELVITYRRGAPNGRPHPSRHPRLRAGWLSPVTSREETGIIIDMFTDDGDVADLGLADTIDAVRLQLLDAQQRGRGQAVQFRVGSVDLELQVEVSRSRGVEGGIQVWVVSAKGSGEHSASQTHTVRVQLTPVTEAGADVMVSDRGAGPARRSPAPGESEAPGGGIQ